MRNTQNCRFAFTYISNISFILYITKFLQNTSKLKSYVSIIEIIRNRRNHRNKSVRDEIN